MLKNEIVLYGCIQFYCTQKTDDIYKEIAENVETRFDPSNYKLNRPLKKAIDNKVIGVLMNKLGGKIKE